MTKLRIEQEYELVDISGDVDVIREHPENPNRGDDEVIDESVDVNGWYGAITCQRSTGYILAGNSRFRVAQKKGATQIPVIWRDCDDETAVKIMLADNQTARRAEMDEAKLEALLQELPSLEGTGFDLVSAQEKLQSDPEEEGDGDEPEVPGDKYDPQWAVIIQCNSERQQEETYRWLQEQLPKRDVRLTAV